VDARLEQLLASESLDAEFARSASFVDQSPDELLQRGSGWGALERLRREVSGERPFCSDALVFDDASLTEAQAPWLALLREGTFPDADPQIAPCSYMVQSEWQVRLEQVGDVATNWQTGLHLGVMHYYAGNRDAAREAWERSLGIATSAWVLRNLALMAWEDTNFDNAATLYSLAVQLQPRLLPLAIECGQKLIAMERPQLWLDLLETLPLSLRKMGRIRLLEGQAALAMSNFKRVAQLFDGTLVIDDLREGERSLSHLWFAYHEKRISTEEGVPVDDALRECVRREHPVPAEIDYRMS
jgi:tetratricopeptide (TPR) repeat protein